MSFDSNNGKVPDLGALIEDELAGRKASPVQRILEILDQHTKELRHLREQAKQTNAALDLILKAMKAGEEN